MSDFTHRRLTIDSYFDKVFYINLDKDVLRNKNIIQQLEKSDILNYERIQAIELKELPPIYRYRNFIRKNEKYILGQLSCMASHLKCIALAKERNYSRIFILEDDIQFTSNPNILLMQNNEILNDWDMLYFGGDIEPFFRNQIVRTHAYAIKNTLFDDILNMAETSGMEIDNFYAKIIQHMSYNYNQSGKYNIRIILPFNQIIPDSSFSSNIHG